MKVSLLDVNVLVALAWPSHIHHQQAHHWFRRNRVQGWATCSITQCGFIRLSSNSNIIREAVSPLEAITLLKEITQLEGHLFWKDTISITEKFVPVDLLVGHRQVTDAYLLGLAIAHKGQLVTLDKKLSGLLKKHSPYEERLHIISAHYVL